MGLGVERSAKLLRSSFGTVWFWFWFEFRAQPSPLPPRPATTGGSFFPFLDADAAWPPYLLGHVGHVIGCCFARRLPVYPPSLSRDGT